MLFQLFRKSARLRFLYCQRYSRLPLVLYRSPRDPVAVSSASASPASANPPPASLRPCSSATTQIRPYHYIFSQTIQLHQFVSLSFLIHRRGRSASLTNGQRPPERQALCAEC
jgi:hypothetical protein